ncbi:LOW QUALITY PROTEIN: axonemal dynein light chain domain-containing protein 1 [Spheniscus humboldti]
MVQSHIFLKYIMLLEDCEKKLCLFPSVKPGRLEVIQLMEVMDSMLEKAGVDKLIRVTGPSQLHNLLELMKVEQNIYNIIFKLIWQVSVDCVERGQLLSKLRQRYVGLLERIPEQMKTLYKKLMAQQVVNRHITEELLYFKESVGSVGQLASELYEVREHDRKVTKEAEKAQKELATAMQEAKVKANLLEEYRELHKLQRRQLEEQVLLLAQERDVWSSAAYDLALKAGAGDQSYIARLHVSGKTLTNILKNFIVLLASKDMRDLIELQEETKQFRESSSPMDEKLLDEILQDIKNLINMLKEDLEQYGEEVHLRKMESLRSAASLQEHWMELGQTLLNQHRDFAGALCPRHTVLEETNQRACELHWQYDIRISGNNVLLSEIKGTPISFLDLEDLRNLFGSEAELRNLFGSEELQLKLKLEDTIISSTQEELEAEDANSSRKPVPKEETLEVKEEIAIMQQQPGAGVEYLTEDNEATADVIRYVGHDSNTYLKALKSDIISVTGKWIPGNHNYLPKLRVGAFQQLLLQKNTGCLLQMKKTDLCLLDPVRSCLFLFSEHCFVGFFTPSQATAISNLCNPVNAPATQDYEPARVSCLSQKSILVHFNKALLVSHSLMEGFALPNQREMTATKSSTPFSQKEFETLAMLEHLQVQLLETEIRAQHAEERSEGLEEKLEESLQRIKELESELEKDGNVIPEATHKEGREKCFQESVSEVRACSSPKASTSGQSKGSRKSKH